MVLLHCVCEYTHGTKLTEPPPAPPAPSQVIVSAVMSLRGVYHRRHLPADQLRSQGVLSLSQNPQLMLQPVLSNELPCEILSLETVHRWILCEGGRGEGGVEGEEGGGRGWGGS